MHDIYILFGILGATLFLFAWGYYRYDIVALMALMSLVITGIIPAKQAFSGFSNPAVISVAAVMVISSAIIQTGFIDLVLKHIKSLLTTPGRIISFTSLTGAILSAFINNVGSLSIIMPMAIKSAINSKISPSTVLMPLAFSTVLGGILTKIGTPPNLIISSYRETLTGKSYFMFDFFPAGIVVATSCIMFILLIGWRLIPIRQKSSGEVNDLYQINDYITEITIPIDSPVVGMKRHELENIIEGDFSILGLIRGRKKKLNIPYDEEFLANDVLIIEASHEDLNSLLLKGKLSLKHGDVISPESLVGEDISSIEAVVTSGSYLHGNSWQKLRIRSRFSINLLAVARSGKSIKQRLNHVNFNPGDVLLIQGQNETLRDNIVNLGLLPIAERTINVGFKRNMWLPIIIFLGGILLNAFQVLSIDIAFTLVAGLMVVFNILPIRNVYKHIDWSIIVLLGALIPLGSALKSTGAAKLIGTSLLTLTGDSSLILILGLLMIITMTLSDIMNNAATAVVMAPIAATLAESLHMNPDPFLMTVCIGASCSFLTPISHQNNTLIMGPGGYRFFDYLWLGIPVELIALVTGVPAIIYFWV